MSLRWSVPFLLLVLAFLSISAGFASSGVNPESAVPEPIPTLWEVRTAHLQTSQWVVMAGAFFGAAAILWLAAAGILQIVRPPRSPFAAKASADEPPPRKTNEANLIRLQQAATKEDFLNGFWQWVQILAEGDYERAIESLYWPKGTTWTAQDLRERITTFFGGNMPWTVVIPNQRLIDVINAAAECELKPGKGWFLATIPLTTEPADPKNDAIPLMGLAISFYVRNHKGAYVMEYEIFHA